MVNGLEYNYQHYQGQEWTEDLGLNWHEWKYRMSDPAIGRFISVDPLAEDYAYNSTYAFQENKLGMGIELEGLELARQRGGVNDIVGGATKALKESTNVRREMAIQGSQGGEAMIKAKHERRTNLSSAMGQSVNGTTELGKGIAYSLGDGLDVAGDYVEKGSLLLAIPSSGASLLILPAAEGSQALGKTIKAAIHASDEDYFGAAQELGEIFLMKSISKLIGGAINNTIKSALDTKNPVTNQQKTIMETTLGSSGELLEEAGKRALEQQLENGGN